MFEISARFDEKHICRFFEKDRKSILIVAQNAAVTHRSNGLAMFLNKRADIIGKF